MDQQKQLEKLVLAGIDTARAMLDEYKMVIPFGIRAFADSEDLKMTCPAEKNPQASWAEQLDMVVAELKQSIAAEPVSVAALVTELESGGESGIGLQIETTGSSALFVYPFRRENELWVIDEPIQTEQLLVSIYH